jgi:hypothetical protein
MRFSVAWSSPKTAVAPMNSVTRPTMVASVPPLWARRSENAGDKLTAGWPHEAFELGRELRGHLLQIEHQPDHTHDEQHQRRQGQGSVGGQ